MAGSAKKSTKKFEKNHLKDTLDKRKDIAKIKQRQQTKAKKQARNAADKARAPELSRDGGVETSKIPDSDIVPELSKMSVDEFFQGGFDMSEKTLMEGSRRKTGVNISRKRKRNVDADDLGMALPNGGVDDAGLESDNDALGSAKENIFEMHKEDLDALAEKDPEFYKYLKENDAELLDFDDDKDFAEATEGSDEEGTRQKHRKKEDDIGNNNQEKHEDFEVTLAMLNKWKTAMIDQRSLRAMRQVVLAFRSAVDVNSDERKTHKYAITDAEVYHELLVTALEHVPTVLTHHLPPKELPSGKVRVATNSKKFRSLSPLLQSYSASIHQLLESLSDPPTIKLTLNALHPLIPYLLSFNKVLQDLTKMIVSIWSATTSTSAETTLITAFLLVRRLFVLGDPNLRTAIFKTVYLNLVKASRTTNTHTLPTINVLKASAAELWGIDSTTGYTTGFTHIRQLAIHLRGTITKPTKDSYKAIYNWQYVHSLDFWARVLSMHCSPASSPHLKKPEDSPLHPLIYPLVQITLGALRLIPTPAYFPLRFHLTRSLLRISRTTNTYIPLAPSLLEVLNSPDMTKPPKASTLAPLDFTVVLKAPKSYLRTRTYQDGLGQQVQELLTEFFACWAKNIAFPELIVPPTVVLKRWLKSTSSFSGGSKPGSKIAPGDSKGRGNKNAKIHSSFTLLLQKLSVHASFIEGHRSKVTFAPGNRQEVDGFLKDVKVEETPLGAFAEGMRLQKEQRDKLLATAKREERRAKGNPRGGGEGDDEEEEDAIEDENAENRDEDDAEDLDADELED